MNNIARITMFVLLIKTMLDLISIPLRLKVTFEILQDTENYLNNINFIFFLISNMLSIISLAIGLGYSILNKGFLLSKWIKIPIIYISIIFISSNILKLFYNSNINFDSNFDQIKYYSIFIFTLLSIVLYATYSILYFKQYKPVKEIEVSNNYRIRILNFVIDTIMIVFFSAYLKINIKGNIKYIVSIYLIIGVVSLFYYLFSELIYRQSIGKAITNTYVKSDNGFIIPIIKRTFIRIIPFDPFSFIIGKKAKWHDKFSKTSIVKIDDK